MLRTSFIYDPMRQGFDANLWRTLQGVPSDASFGRIEVNQGSAVHYADLLKGEFFFDINSPTAPGADEDRVFGLFSPSTGDRIVFSLSSTLIATMTKDGVVTSSSAIAWNPAWTSANTIFRIVWEQGLVRFTVAGTQVACLAGDVPHGPLSLFLSDFSASAMTVGAIRVLGTEYFIPYLKTSDSSSAQGSLRSFSSVTTTENITMLIPMLFGYPSDVSSALDVTDLRLIQQPNIYDSAATSESETILIPTLVPSVEDDSSTVENVALVVVGP